ncbi:MAG: RHS repeat domain-containing protein [bacterium]
MPIHVMKRKKMRLVVTFILSFFIIHIVLPVIHPQKAEADCPSHSGWYVGGQTGDTSSGSDSPGKSEGDDSPSQNSSEGAEPVNFFNGNFTYSHEDFSIPARGIPLSITHEYSSQTNYNSFYGYGWSINYDMSLSVFTDGIVLVRKGLEDQRKFTFSEESGEYVPPAGVHDTLIKNENGTFTLTEKHGKYYEFDTQGKLTAIGDRNDNKITIHYSVESSPIRGKFYGCPYLWHTMVVPDNFVCPTGIIALKYRITEVEDALGRKITFSYDDTGRLEKIVDYAAREYSYEYDEDGNLIKVTNPMNYTKQFAYDDNHNLTQITDAKGQIFLINHYDEEDRVDWQTYGNGTAYFEYKEDFITTYTDYKGFVTDFYHNSNGNAIREVNYTAGLREGEPENYVTFYEYNDNMDRTKIIHPEGNQTSFTYDDKSNLLEIRKINPSGDDIVTSFTYEPQFNLIKTKTDPRGNVTTYTYDHELEPDDPDYGQNGNLIKITHPTAEDQTPEEKYTYNNYGQVESIKNPGGVVTKYEYYETGVQNGYLKKTIKAFGTVDQAEIVMDYDAVGNMISYTDELGHITSYSYNTLNLVTQIQSPSPFNYSILNTYDENGNVARVDRQMVESIENPLDPPNNPDNWQTILYSYTILNKVTSITDDLGNITTLSYDKNENLILREDAELNKTGYIYDERNLLWKETDALVNTTTYSYDKNSNLSQIKDAKGNITSYTYDVFDRQKKITYPDNSYEEYSYDLASNMTAKRTRKGDTISFLYDNLNRQIKKTYPDSTITDYVYDISSRLTNTQNTVSSIDYIYNNLDKFTKVIYPNNKELSYEYNKSGYKTKLIYPDNTFITFEYNQLNQLVNIKDHSSSIIASYSYDALSRRSKVEYANNTQAIYAFNDINHLTSLENKIKDGDTLSSFDYTYDKVGNRRSMTTTDGIYAYTYDDIYQLKSVDYPDNYPFSDTVYSFDEVGNRINTSNLETIDYTRNNLNQYTNVGDTAYTYDDNGNLTSDEIWLYSYNCENKLITASDSINTTNYNYGPFGRRKEKNFAGVVTKYIYDGDQIIAEYDENDTLIRKYVYGSRIDEPLLMDNGVNKYYFHFDGLGSVNQITNASGVVVESYSYDIYGKPNITSSIDNPYLFAGRRYDKETGIYYYRARYYSPVIGRFLQTDPISFAGGDINLYRYVNNNPVNYLDQWGLCKEGSWWEGLIPDAITISISGAAFSPWLIGAGGGIEFVYIFGEGWVVYAQGGLGIGVPGGGGGIEFGPIWNLEEREDYTGPFIEFQGGATPVGGSIFGWPGGPGGFKVGPYIGTPGGGALIEYYIDVEKTAEKITSWGAEQIDTLEREILREIYHYDRDRHTFIW